METLTKKEAIEFLGLDDKIFDNYFKNAKEFPCIDRIGSRGRFLFYKSKLREWAEERKWRMVDLDKKDYAICLDFALAQHFKGYVLSDFGSGRQREFGQKITNWVKGQLGEIALKKFFKKEFGLNIKLDFEIRDDIVPQDITGVFENGKLREPKIGIGIKSSKPKNAFLILGGNEMKLKERKSEIYIYCRPDIPDDHILRITKKLIVDLVKDEPHFSKYKDYIPDFTNIPCEIAGWCRADELREVTSIPGQDFDNGTRFVIESGLLHRSRKDWETLIKKI